MDKNGKQLVSYKNNSRSISLREYINKGINHFFITMSLDDNIFSFDIKIRDEKIVLTICLSVIIPSVIIIIIIVIIIIICWKKNKRKNVICNPLEINNNDYNTEENNSTYEYIQYPDYENIVTPDNSNERYLNNNQYHSANNNQKHKDFNNSNNSAPTPYDANQKNEEEDFSLFPNIGAM